MNGVSIAVLTDDLLEDCVCIGVKRRSNCLSIDELVDEAEQATAERSQCSGH